MKSVTAVTGEQRHACFISAVAVPATLRLARILRRLNPGRNRPPLSLSLKQFGQTAFTTFRCQGFLADRDVDIVRRSTKGMGTNEGNLVNTLCNRTKKQIDAADLLYHKKVCACVCEVATAVTLFSFCFFSRHEDEGSRRNISMTAVTLRQQVFFPDELTRVARRGEWS